MPILDIAIRGAVIAAADGEGAVRTWRLRDGRLESLATLHENAKKPITALAATDTGFIGAGASLVSWSEDGKQLARATLPAVATNVVVRNATVYVLAGGKLLSFALPKLAPKKTWAHRKGVSCDLDVDDAEKRAIVVIDRTQVEIIELAGKKKSVTWTRKGDIEAAYARFSRDGKIVSVAHNDMTLSRVSDKTGRVTGEVLRFHSFSNGPIVMDRARAVAFIGAEGENASLVDLTPPKPRFDLDPRLTDGQTKSRAALGRIPTFKKLAPGFYARHGSIAAPESRVTLTAIATNEGGGIVAAGYVNDELVVADTTTAAVASTLRGTLGEGRQIFRIGADEVLAWTVVDDALWALRNDGRFVIVDLATQKIRDGIQLAGELPKVNTMSIDAATITATSWSLDRITQWSRKDGSLLGSRELPEHKGVIVHQGRILVLPISTLGHEGFDIVSLDLATGATQVVSHFTRDAKRFALGSDPEEWVRLGAAGTQPTLTIWAGKGLTAAQVFAFDVATATLGRELPGFAEVAAGPVVAKPDFTNPLQARDGVSVMNMETRTEVMRCPYEPGDSPRINTAGFDPVTKNVAALVSDSIIAVWRPGASRLLLHGHDGVKVLQLRGKTLVSFGHYTGLRVWNIG